VNSNLDLFDLDGTLIYGNGSFSFCCYLVKKSILSPFHLLYALFVYLLSSLGFLSQRALHEKIFAHALRGKKLSQIESFIPSFLSGFLERSVNPSTLSYLQEAQKSGSRVVLLSNSPSFLVAPIAVYFGIEEWGATEYRVDEKGVFCDIAHVMDGEAKAAYAAGLISGKKNITVYSDSYQDLPLLQMATKTVLVNPDRKLLRWKKGH